MSRLTYYFDYEQIHVIEYLRISRLMFVYYKFDCFYQRNVDLIQHVILSHACSHAEMVLRNTRELQIYNLLDYSETIYLHKSTITMTS